MIQKLIRYFLHYFHVDFVIVVVLSQNGVFVMVSEIYIFFWIVFLFVKQEKILLRRVRVLESLSMKEEFDFSAWCNVSFDEITGISPLVDALLRSFV